MSDRLNVCRVSLVLFLAATLSLPACQTTTEAGAVGVDRKQTLLLSSEQVNEAAVSAYRQIVQAATQKGALNRNPAHVQRVRAITQRLIPATAAFRKDAPGWNWEVNVIESPQVNAWAMPGGKIAVYSGLIEKLNLTDDELAAILGHEIAHALREHGRERLAKSSLTGIGARVGGALISGIFGIDPNITGTVANYAGQMLVLKFSRDEEREADLVGLDISARAGYDPRAGIALWRKMAALGKRTPLEILSTHPGGETRIADIESHMNVLLPLYARTKGTSAAKLPPYRTNVALR